MSTDTTELESFRQFLDEQIASGRTDLSPEDSLAIWRTQQADLEETVAAVKQALADMDAGETGQPLHEFAADFRKRNNIPSDA